MVSEPISNYRGLNTLVLGLGRFGGALGAVRFLAQHGAQLTVADEATAEQLAEPLQQLRHLPIDRICLGPLDEHLLDHTQLVIANPAVRPDHPLLRSARQRAIPISSEIQLFLQHNPGRVVGVTGSNGKSTTAQLIFHMLQQAGHKCWIGGNLGGSLLSRLPEIESRDWVVLELSSFQLQALNSVRYSPHVAVLTNCSPNHLNWHAGYADYRACKQTLLRWQRSSDFSVINLDDPTVRGWIGAAQRLTYTVNPAVDPGSTNIQLGPDHSLHRHHSGRHDCHQLAWPADRLPGLHNRSNVAAAAAAVTACDVDLPAIEAGLQSFEPLPYRLQRTGRFGPRLCINDSLATTVESTLAALQAYSEPIHIIVGGADKGQSLTPLCAALKQHARSVACIGTTGPSIASHLLATADHSQLEDVRCFDDFEEAVRWTWQQAAAGGVVLLSPACASLDWFESFQHRGQRFETLIQDLANAE